MLRGEKKYRNLAELRLVFTREIILFVGIAYERFSHASPMIVEFSTHIHTPFPDENYLLSTDTADITVRRGTKNKTD